MQKRLRVTIVIPAYNEERHLAECLDAIATQTSPVLEAIVVDNNSSDRTAAIAKRYPFVRVISETQQGIVFARNAGFNAARGDIIGRTDAHIALPPTWVEHIQDFYADQEHQRQAWVGGGYFYNVRMPRLTGPILRLLGFGLNRLLLGHPTLWGSNMALLKTQWQRVESYTCRRTDIHEDLDLAMHLVRDCHDRIHHDPSCIVPAPLHGDKDRHRFWEYLQWWPRTLRVHGYASWWIVWLFGAAAVYGLQRVHLCFDRVIRWFGRAPLPE